MNQQLGATIRAGAGRPAAILHAIGLGLVLPHVFFVNDLGHPLQTGVIFCLLPAGMLVGKWVWRLKGRLFLARRLVVRSTLLTLAYLLIAASAEFHPIGIMGLRLAQLSWFLLGLFGVGLLLPRSSCSAVPTVDISAGLGAAAGALLSSVLVGGVVRSAERYDLSELLAPALVAAGFSAMATLLLLVKRKSEAGLEGARDVLISEGSDLRDAIGISACAAGAVAVACTLTPMLLWETFGFSPGGVASMIGRAGFVAIGVLFLVRRGLRGMGSVKGVIDIAGIGLLLLGLSSGLLMLTPNTKSGPLLFAGIAALAGGWAFSESALMRILSMSSMENSREGYLRLNDRVRLAAWIIGPIISASIFYAHERTSFGLSGVMIALAAAPFAGLWWRHRRGMEAEPVHAEIEAAKRDAFVETV